MLFSERLAVLISRSGARNPVEAMFLMARRLLDESKDGQPPFAPKRYCDIVSVEVDKIYLGDCDARLLPVKGGYIAEIHKSHRRPRQNFSICHEVAHTFFSYESRTNTSESVSCSETYSDSHKHEERLCNLAAAELLMPADSFRGVSSKFVPSLDSVERLAEIYDVTTFATAKRIVDLNLWPCTFVYIKPVTETGSNAKFQIRSFLASESIRSRRGGAQDLISCLSFRLDMMGEDRFGIEEVLRTGEQTSAEFGSFGNRFSLNLRRFFSDGQAQIMGLAFHNE